MPGVLVGAWGEWSTTLSASPSDGHFFLFAKDTAWACRTQQNTQRKARSCFACAQQGQTDQLVHRTKLSALWITVSRKRSPFAATQYGSHQHWQHMAQVQNVLMLRQRGEGTHHAKGPRTQRGRQELIPRNPRSQGCGQAPVDAAPEDDNVTGSGWCVGARGKGQWRAVQCLAPWISLEGQAPCCQNHSFVWLGCGSLTPLVGWLAPPVQPRAPAPRWLTIPATRTHDVFVVPDGCGVKQTRAPQQRDKGGQSDGDQVNPSPCTSCQFKAP
jgi:hypothetical protein